jgi:hypothetical protein
MTELHTSVGALQPEDEEMIHGTDDPVATYKKFAMDKGNELAQALKQHMENATRQDGSGLVYKFHTLNTRFAAYWLPVITTPPHNHRDHLSAYTSIKDALCVLMIAGYGQTWSQIKADEKTCAQLLFGQDTFSRAQELLIKKVIQQIEDPHEIDTSIQRNF